MEVNEGELPEVAGLERFLEPEPCTDGQDKDESVTVGVTFLEKVDPCILADSYVVSGCVKMELGAEESVEGNPKWACDNCLCFCWSEGVSALRHTNKDKSGNFFFLSRTGCHGKE